MPPPPMPEAATCSTWFPIGRCRLDRVSGVSGERSAAVLAVVLLGLLDVALLFERLAGLLGRWLLW